MAPPSSSNRENQKRILVVEDDYTNRLLFNDYLNHLGSRVLALPDGGGLKEHLETFHPHLLLLDVGLPTTDGLTLLRYIRADPQWKSLPVVIISGYAFPSDRQKALEAGAQQYLFKPVRLPELEAILVSLIG